MKKIGQIGGSTSLDWKYYFIVVFIYVSVFINSLVLFTSPFEFYLGYLVFLLLLPAFIQRYGFNRGMSFIFLILLVNGIINIMIGDNTAAQFFKVYLGLTLSYFFYYYVVLEFDYDVQKLFRWYLKGSYYVALIGLVQFVSFQIGFKQGYDFSWILNKWGVALGGNFGIRINSIFGEPTFLGAVLSAAFFVSLHNFLRSEPYYISRFQSGIIILVYLLSFSGLGQIGIFVTLLLLVISFGMAKYFFLVIPLGLMLFNFVYNNSKEFSERYDSLIALFSEGKFVLGKTHGSSFILYNNYKVVLKNFQTNYLFGTGIGSHMIAFQKYSLARDFKITGFNNNSADANSMLLRLISETGIFGTGIFLFIVFRFYVRRNSHYDTNHWLISNAILVMILLNLFRQGHYFLNGFPFFVILYYFNWKSYKLYQETGKTLYEQTMEEQGITVKEGEGGEM